MSLTLRIKFQETSNHELQTLSRHPPSPSQCPMVDQPHLPGGETEAHTVEGHDQATAFSEARSHYILHNEGSGAPVIPVETQ